MFSRPIHKNPFPIPRGMGSQVSSQLIFENVSHTPGQPAAVRFFDPHSQDDLFAMREILKGKQVKKWMDGTEQLTMSDYQDWAGTFQDNSFLFAVLDARITGEQVLKDVKGFIYLYSEREEKFRVKRMEKHGFVEHSEKPRHLLEISFAVRPLRDGEQSGSGLMGSAIRQSCLQVQMLLSSPEKPEVVIFAFVDQGNIPAQRTLESSGFIRKGLMKYDWDSPEETTLYILSWRALQKKVREKMLEVLQKQEDAV